MANTETNYGTKWADLPVELLDLILSKLSSFSIFNFKAVCPSWRSAGKAYVSSRFYIMANRVPWLMLPTDEENDNKVSFFSLEEKKVVYKRINRPCEFKNGLFLGSSHGWMVMMDGEVALYLFNPFTLATIQLPPLDNYRDMVSFSYSDDDDDIIDLSANLVELCWNETVKNRKRQFFKKAVLSSNPSNNIDFFFLMIIELGGWGESQLEFWRSGDSKWTRLGGSYNVYLDIICYNDNFSALNGNTVEFWDIVDGSPVMRNALKVSSTCDSVETGYIRSYLVESSGDLLLIRRQIDDSYTTYIYKTQFFRIFKLNFALNKWEEVESLGDNVLFLGGFQSKLLSTRDAQACEANSVYFTDDNWYGICHYDSPYDIGLFNIKEKSIKSYYQCDLRTEPPPFWIDPTSLLA